MKSLPLLCLVLSLAAFAGDDTVVRLSEPVESGDGYEVFGAAWPSAASALSLAELLADPAQNAGKPAIVETRVSQVCQKKGCFFIATDGDVAVRVSFRDYGFFVPTDIGGRTVKLAGTLVERKLSDEQAAHFAEDLGGGAAIQAGVVYEIIADSVRIPTRSQPAS